MSCRAGDCVHVVVVVVDVVVALVVVVVVAAVDVVLVGKSGCCLVRCWSLHWCFFSGSRCSLGCCAMGVVAVVMAVGVCLGGGVC